MLSELNPDIYPDYLDNLRRYIEDDITSSLLKFYSFISDFDWRNKVYKDHLKTIKSIAKEHAEMIIRDLVSR